MPGSNISTTMPALHDAGASKTSTPGSATSTTKPALHDAGTSPTLVEGAKLPKRRQQLLHLILGPLARQAAHKDLGQGDQRGGRAEARAGVAGVVSRLRGRRGEQAKGRPTGQLCGALPPPLLNALNPRAEPGLLAADGGACREACTAKERSDVAPSSLSLLPPPHPPFSKACANRPGCQPTADPVQPSPPPPRPASGEHASPCRGSPRGRFSPRGCWCSGWGLAAPAQA
eukprot:353543-Chlamydomonas_euryale.AAC.1